MSVYIDDKRKVDGMDEEVPEELRDIETTIGETGDARQENSGGEKENPV